jgi:hypothetical protein
MLQVEKKQSVTINAGTSGTGKSTFTLRNLVNAPLDLRFIFDPESEYSQRLQMPAARTLYELSVQLCQGWVIFDPHTLFAGKLEEAFAFFCNFAFQLSEDIPGRKLLVVDEAWRYVSTRKQPDELANCVQSGRKRGLESMFNTQMPNLLYSAIRNECTELVCFRLEDDNALDFAKQKGMDVEEIRRLPDLHFVARNLKTRGELRGEIAI